MGFGVGVDERGTYAQGTRAAVEAFQHRRGLRVDGVCGRQTWAALVEAGYRLGDRLLYLRRPMLRGDDVAELQQRLSALGFDTGRVDGIFGDLTASALAEFQRNIGLSPDGIAGGDTIEELRRMQARHGERQLVSEVRDRERLRAAPRTLYGRHLAVGGEGGISAVANAVRRNLITAGAKVTLLHHPDGSAQAAHANAADVDVYLGLRLYPDAAHCSTAYYSGYRYTSEGGRHLAELIQKIVPSELGVPDDGAVGMSLPLLRETRMPAVICEIGPPALVVERSPDLARAMSSALSQWVGAPLT